jgi:hypothetical protein
MIRSAERVATGDRMGRQAARHTAARPRWGAFALAATLVFATGIKVFAADRTSWLGDEPTDARDIAADRATVSHFFTHADEPDQARLPMLIAAPIVLTLKDDSLFLTRVEFILLYGIYLVIFYKTLRLKLSRPRAYFGFMVVALSAYLSSFAVFTMTTSNTLFLVFAMAALYYYLAHFEARRAAPTARQLLLLGALLGLATASRLFGLLVLAPMLVYDWWLERQRVAVAPAPVQEPASMLALPVERLNIAFTAVWLLVNVVPIPQLVKTVLALVAAALYVIGLVLAGRSTARPEGLPLSYAASWCVVIHTAFAVTLVASPIYLNVHNVLGAWKWFHRWDNRAHLAYPSHLDIFTIVGVKLGLVALVAIVVALIVLWRRHELRTMARDQALLFLVAAFQLAIFAASRWVLAWYPLLVFPYLYLPLCYVVPDRVGDVRRASGIAMVAMLIAVPVYEQWRYWSLFPYAHTDGAQLGPKFVGGNKPGFITFEGLPPMLHYLADHQSRFEVQQLGCDFVDDAVLNNWAITVVNDSLRHSHLAYTCETYQLTDNDPLVITSNYTPAATTTALARRYVQRRVVTVNTVHVATLWERASGAPASNQAP